ncbi:MAG TPA: NAD(P)H-hydrate dehydratase [Tenuifilaceae bacterium]|nr:NAD(P)H-hydrate dehydratase [Tenuifilaceae bacterium]
MKLFTTKQIRELDAYTIKHEPISSYELMERAANALYSWFAQNLSTLQPIVVFCGPGNNGGDGLALARLLYTSGYSVEVYYLTASAHSSDFQLNLERLKAINFLPVEIFSNSGFPHIGENHVVVDAIFGSGLSKPIEGLAAQLVSHINTSGSRVVAVDIPSGLFGEENPFPNSNPVVRAADCLTLQFPKLSFFFAENSSFVGRWHVLPIGLHPEAIAGASTSWHYTNMETIRGMVKPRERFAHKGIFGHCLVVAGSHGMIGAAVMAAMSAARAGAGLVTLHVPACGYEIAQTLAPNIMVVCDSNEHHLSAVDDFQRYNAVCIGPGLGQHPETADALGKILAEINVPLILDADALNLVAANPKLLGAIPAGTIITPHPGEFDRLFGVSTCGWKRLERAREVAQRYQQVIILKGAYSQVVLPDGRVFFNSTGNPGMATGGSGDVLSGIVVGFLAQGFSIADAALLATFVHGLAGDIAASDLGENALVATDMISYISNALLEIEISNL